MLEELEAKYKLRQRFRQLEQAQATEKASAANVTKASHFLAPHMSKRDRHSFLDAVEKQLLSLRGYRQAVMQAKEISEKSTLLQQHAFMAEWVVQLQRQIEYCRSVNIQCQEAVKTFHAILP